MDLAVFHSGFNFDNMCTTWDLLSSNYGGNLASLIVVIHDAFIRGVMHRTIPEGATQNKSEAESRLRQCTSFSNTSKDGGRGKNMKNELNL